MTNELQKVDSYIGAVVEENNDYKVVKLQDGTFKKVMKYKQLHTFTPTTKEEKLQLFKVFNDVDNEIVIQLKNALDKDLTIKHIYFNPYESLDEKTGENKYGVTTTIEDVNGNYFATSSKSVYYTLLNVMDAFGSPADVGYEPITMKVVGIKRENGVQITLKLEGI